MEKYSLLAKLAKCSLNIALKLTFESFSPKNCRSKKGLKQCLGGIQSEYKEKQEDAKGKLQSDIQCTFC